MNRRLALWLALLAWSATVAGAAEATNVRLVSPERRVAVLELFTSHGCSSCPPADAWLRRFADHADLWQAFIPIAFHVDYWDRLGWPDRFASPVFSRRQAAYRDAGRLRSVYTPGFVVAGREWQGWFRGEAPTLSPGPEVGRLSLASTDGGPLVLRFAPRGKPPPDLRAHVAVLGFGLSSAIGGGENRGRVLAEDFVVLGYRSAAAVPGALEWHLEPPDAVLAEAGRRAVVAWVSAGEDPAPLQAVGGWLGKR